MDSTTSNEHEAFPLEQVSVLQAPTSTITGLLNLNLNQVRRTEVAEDR